MLRACDRDQLRPVHQDDLLASPSRWMRLGGVVLVGAFSIAVALTTVIRYDTKVRAIAAVRPAGGVRLVEAGVEGTIQKITVTKNQAIAAGDVIAYIDDSRQQTRKRQLQDQIRQGQQQLSQLAAQVQALDSQMAAESSVQARSMATAQADLDRAERTLQDQRVITTAEVEEAEANLALAQDERDRFSEAAEAGAISRLQFAEKQQAVVVAQARLHRAQATMDPTDANVTAAQERIAQEQARGEATLASLTQERKSLIQRQLELEHQLQQDRRDVQQVDRDLKRSMLRSPVQGTILELGLSNPGQFVQPGDMVARVAPGNAKVAVKALVPAQDIGKVALNQRAQLRISAYPYPDYGTLEGTVGAISPDAVSGAAARQFTPTSSTPALAPAAIGTNPHYEVTIHLQRPYFEKTAPTGAPSAPQRYALQPGMEGSVDIIAQEDTLLKFILRKARLLTDL